MDLGFGKSNQKVGDSTASALLQLANAQENAITEQLHDLDRVVQRLGDDDDSALQTLRTKRLAEMKAQAKQSVTYRENGHGTYEELGGSSKNDVRDVAKDFFAITKQSKHVLVHFYRPSSPYCDIYHKHLERICRKHIETRIVKIDVEDCDKTECGAGFLVERLGVIVMPTLVLISNRRAVHQIRGFDEILQNSEGSSVDDITTFDIISALVKHEVMSLHEDDEDYYNDE